MRELIFVHEEQGQMWAKKMIDLLCEIKDNSNIAKTKGKKLQKRLINEYEKRYKKDSQGRTTR